MKKAYNFSTLATLLLTLVLAGSCSKSFLEKNPVGPVTESTLATREGVNGLLIGAYSMLDGVGTGGTVWNLSADNWVIGGLPSDDAHAGTYGNLPDQEAFEAFKQTPTNNVLAHKWKALYTGIQRANDVLRVLAIVPSGGLTADEITQIKAEAIFLRALYHLEAAKIWGNVPYVDETIGFGENNYLVSNTVPIWPLIEKDFKFAADNLSNTKAKAGAANKWAAKSFLAKTYMFEHKYTDAKPLLEDIIANGVTSKGQKYALEKYADNFDATRENGPECIFAVQYAVKDGSNGLNGNASDVLNQPRVPLATGGGNYQPSFSLANSFKTDPVTGLPLIYHFNDEDLKNDQGLSASDPFTPYDGTVDSRLDWTIARRGIPLFDWGLFGSNSNWIYDQAVGGPYMHKKTFFRKGATSTYESYGGWTTVNSTNYNFIRFADVLLWAAEVEVEIGSLAKAESYVNKVRERAADPTGWVTTYVDNSDPSKGFTNTPAANYYVGLYNGEFVLKGKDFARDAVRFERKLEFGMEGQRFYDLQRWDNGTGYMADVMNAYLQHETHIPGFTYSNCNGVNFQKGKNELMPIPQTEIDKSVTNGSSVLEQNPNW